MLIFIPSSKRLGSITSETLPYFLGLPLVSGTPSNLRNYSRGDVAVAESAVALLAAFAKTGDPTARSEERHHDNSVTWPRYEINTQQYLSIGKENNRKITLMGVGQTSLKPILNSTDTRAHKREINLRRRDFRN